MLENQGLQPDDEEEQEDEVEELEGFCARERANAQPSQRLSQPSHEGFAAYGSIDLQFVLATFQILVMCCFSACLR